MGRIFGIFLIVVAIWVGLTVYTEGVDRAYGGLFARLGLAEPPPRDAVEAVDPARRIGERVGSGYRFHEDRTRRLIGGE